MAPEDRRPVSQRSDQEPLDNFRPYIDDGESVAEFTFKSIFIGAVFGILFGAANAYLGLLAGITVSTSIPVAVMTVGFFRLTQRFFGRASILESNISQTTGSASSSLASGVIFTVPALFLWGMNPTIFEIAGLAALGGLLGVLFMIPLRRLLIKQEHGKLPYPEGTACAKVLVAADSGGAGATNVFWGLGVGVIYKFLIAFLYLWKDKVYFYLPLVKKAQIGITTTPALLAVGYILGYRVASIMVAGSLISWAVLIPLMAHVGENLSVPLFPELTVPIGDMSPSEIWNRYIRYIGAGAVAFGGIITIIKSAPTMVRSLRIGVDEMKSRMASRNNVPGDADADVSSRTDRDLSFKYVVGGVLLIIAALVLIPNLLGGTATFNVRLVAAPAIALFAFLFVTVSSRIVGLVGVSSNPTSGMTIVTLLIVSGIFVYLGWTDVVGKVTALTVGTVVCVAASIAGDTSQDLKTGFLLGATPYKQQIAELIGAASSALAVAASIIILNGAYKFGSPELPAPQATLMKTIIEGVLQAGVPWGLVLIGVLLGAIIELCSLPSLPFAVGLYLPVSTMTPIFVGGCIRYFIERKYHGNQAELNRRSENGILFSSGLIGGEGLLSVGIALYVFYYGKPGGFPISWTSPWGEVVSLTIFAALGYLLVRRTRSG